MILLTRLKLNVKILFINSNMLNILFINQFINPIHGGVERVSCTLANELRNRGHHLFFLHTSDDELPKESPYKKVKYGIDGFEQFIKDNHITTIINQGAHSYSFCKIIKNLKLKFPNIKIISCLHNDPIFLWKGIEMTELDISNRSIFQDFNLKSITKKLVFPLYSLYLKNQYRRTYALSYKYSDYLVLLSERFRNKFCSLANLKQDDKIVSIFNPIIKDTSELSEKQNIAIIMARLSPVKRIDMAVKAWSIALKNNPQLNNWRLYIYGDGECREQLQKLIQELGLSNVNLKGYTSTPLKVLQNASIFLMTSSYEGFPITLLECQSQGTIPISFDSFDAVKDIITPDKNGIIVKDSDIIGMANSINRLVNDYSLREEMSINAFNSVEKFAMDNIINQWEKYIQ